jgi:hypothetical protein
MARWDLKPGMRVWVKSAQEIGVVNRISARRIDVEVYFPKSFHQGCRVFLYDEGLVPVDVILEQVLGPLFFDLYPGAR